MADTKTTLTWLLRDEVSPVARKVNGSLSEMEAKAKSGSGIMGKLSSATGGLVNPATLALGAIGVLTAGIGEAIHKSEEHEVILKRLDTTLAANVKGYDGNRSAIDAYIDKQTNLGFTVDETTASLAQLVTATGSVQRAQEFQSAAEDLARLKGISLADATDAMTKVEAGRFKGLANLGIVLQKGATATDALAAVQKVAGGQADAYGKTVSGSFAKVNAKIDDAMTKIGDALLPVVAALAGFFADTLIPAVEGVAKALGDTLGPAFDVVGKGISFFVDHVIGPAIDVIKHLIGFIHDALKFLGILHDAPLPNQTASGVATGAGGHAAGGMLDPGWNLVGEQGPELIGPDRQVYTAAQTRSMQGGGGSPVVLHVNLDGRSIAKVVDEHLYYASRTAAATRLRA